MFAAPWVCRSCLRAATRRPLIQFSRQARAASSLPPVLLERARNISEEHAQLSAANADDFDAKRGKRIGEIARVADAFKQWDAANASLAELRGLLQSEDAELRELASDDLEETNAQLETLAKNLSVALTPKHPFAGMPCLLEIRPGPGGMEGRFFADSLVQMYQKYCSYKGYRMRVVKYEKSDSSGESGSMGEVALQEAVLEVEDTGAYGLFRGEAGMHRVQRVPATEKMGRTHTSAVAVWVLPSFPESSMEEEDHEDPESDFYINPADVRSETMRARGAGGQHVNKTESAIRLTHVPTGITVSMQDSRSQTRNRADAWRLLRSRIGQKRREEREETARNLRSSVLAKSQVTRGDKIRTYQFQQIRVTDHRTGFETHDIDGVVAGGESLDKMIESVREWQAERDIQALIDDEMAAAAVAQSRGSKK
ncbi:mitochondrial translation release factor [Thozetella sp. PMI_491]|nr:mitochondrial translation release factor [Thozetella sp. PMI_491]